MAIAIDYVFQMDITPVKIAEDMERFGLPYPIIKNGLTNKITATSDHVFTEEEKAAFIAIVIETYKGKQLDTIRVEDIRFERTENIRIVPDEMLKKE